MTVTPRKLCRSGLNIHRALPNGTVMWVEDVKDWAKDDDVLVIRYATGTNQPGGFTKAYGTMDDSDRWPEGDFFWHQAVYRYGGRIFSNLSSGLDVDTTTVPLSSTETTECEQPDMLALDEDSRFLKSAVFAAIIGISLAIVTQPRGSLLYRWSAPRFWRLVPGFGLYECIVIIFLALIVLPQTRNWQGFCASCMIYRDPAYQKHKHKNTSEIIHIITREAGISTSRLISTAAVVPILLTILKAGSVKGAPLFTWFCVIYIGPYLFLQVIIFMQPHNMWDSRTTARIETSLDRIRVLSRWLSFEEPVKEAQQKSGDSSTSVLASEQSNALHDTQNSPSETIGPQEAQEEQDVSEFIISGDDDEETSNVLVHETESAENHEQDGREPSTTHKTAPHISDLVTEVFMIWSTTMAFTFTILANGDRLPNVFWNFDLPYPWSLLSAFYHSMVALMFTYSALCVAAENGLSHIGRWKWYPSFMFQIMDMVHVVLWGLGVAICVSTHDELGTRKAGWLDWLG